MIDKRYGEIFRQIREQKELPLSYFEKYGILKSNLGRFERGEVMMSFERVLILLRGMDLSLSDYELFFNHYLPDYQEHMLFEIERAELAMDKVRLDKLLDEVSDSENILLVLLAKSKITKLAFDEIEEIKDYLTAVKHWGYFEFTLTQDIVEYLDVEEMKEFAEIFKEKIDFYYDVMKYKRKIHQIICSMILQLCCKGEREFSEILLNFPISLEGERVDFYVSNLRKLVAGCLDYCFKDPQKALLEINCSLEIFEELGSKELRQYYTKKVLYVQNEYKKI